MQPLCPCVHRQIQMMRMINTPMRTWIQNLTLAPILVRAMARRTAKKPRLLHGPWRLDRRPRVKRVSKV